MGIKSCRHKGLEELYLTGKTAKINARFQKNSLLILDHLAAVSSLRDCTGVKNFHELKGERRETYSMHVSGNYCITFRFEEGHVLDLDFEDYH